MLVIPEILSVLIRVFEKIVASKAALLHRERASQPGDKRSVFSSPFISLARSHVLTRPDSRPRRAQVPSEMFRIKLMTQENPEGMQRESQA